MIQKFDTVSSSSVCVAHVLKVIVLVRWSAFVTALEDTEMLDLRKGGRSGGSHVAAASSLRVSGVNRFR